MKARPKTMIEWLTSTPDGIDQLERMFDKAKDKTSGKRLETATSDASAEASTRQNL